MGPALQTTSPPQPRQAITLSLLFSAGVINFFDRTSLSIANNTIRAEMHLTATDMGWLLSAFSLAYGLAQLPLVDLIYRKGPRLVLGAGLGLWSAAQALTALVRGMPSFLALRVLLGAGEAPFYPCAVQTVRDWFPERSRGRATAIMSSSQTFGLAIAPPILAFLILRIGWRGMFVALGLAGLVVAAAWLLLYRSPPSDTVPEIPSSRPIAPTTNASSRPERPTGSPASLLAGVESAAETPPHSAQLTRDVSSPPQPERRIRDTTSNTPPPHPFKILLKQRTVWGMMLGFGGINYTVWLYLTWIPGYLQTARHLSLARTGLLAAIPFLGGAAGMLSSGFVADALAHRGVPLTTVHRVNLVTGMILSAASTFAVARSESTTAAVAGITAAVFFIHFAGTSGWGYVQVITLPRYVASLSALQNFASFLIASVAPVLTGFLLDRTRSFTLALGLCSVITLLGALSYATLARPSGMHLRPHTVS